MNKVIDLATVLFVEIAFAFGFALGGNVIRFVIRKEAEAAARGQRLFWTPARKALAIALILIALFGIVQTIILG